MSYEKELEYLRKEFKKYEDKFSEAEREGYETDADIWQNDMVNIGHQIHIHERAAKADEYEAKAEAFDRIVKESKGTFSCGDFCDDVRHIINNYEIGVATDD